MQDVYRPAFDDNSIEYFEHRARMREFYLRRGSEMMRVSVVMLAVFPLVFAVIYLIPPVQGLLRAKQHVVEAELEGMQRIPDLEQKIAKLDSQISILSTESIDARLQTVERAMQVGQLKPEDIATLVEIKQDVGTLKTYMFRDPKELVELKELQKNYQTMASAQNQYATKEALRSEIGTLQTILTISLAILGILFTVIFGSWLRRGPRTETPTRPIHRPSDETASTDEQEVNQ